MDDLVPHAAVVRGGENLTYDGLVKSLAATREKGCPNAVSVRADLRCTDEGPGLTPQELCQGLPHSQVRWSTAGGLQAAGIELVYTPSKNHIAHFSAVLGEPVEESILAFIACFSDPEPDPDGGKRRSK